MARRRRQEEQIHSGVPEKLRRYRAEEWPEIVPHPDPFRAYCGVPYGPAEQFWDARQSYEQETGYDFGWPYGDDRGDWPSLDGWDERCI